MLPFPGPRCEGNIDECVSNPCQNNGRCIDAANRYRCLCPDGFTGLHCETNVDECTAVPCLHGRYGLLAAPESRKHRKLCGIIFNYTSCQRCEWRHMSHVVRS